MMLRFFLLLVFSSASLYSATDFWIYSYGDVTTLKDAFNYLSNFRDNLNYQDLIMAALLGGGIIAITFKQALGVKSVFIYYGGATLLMLLIFGKTSSVNVVNVRFYVEGTTPIGKHYARIDNVPYVFAAIAGSFSQIGYWFTEYEEDAFVAVGGEYAEERKAASFLNAGLNGTFTLFNHLNKHELETMSADAQILMDNYKNYMKLCVFPIAYSYDYQSVTSLIKKSQNLSVDLNPAVAPLKDIVNISDEEVVVNGGLTTCSVVYNNFKGTYDAMATNSDIEDFFNKALESSLSNPADALGGIAGMFAGAEGGDSATKLKSYVLNTALMKRTAHSFNEYSNDTGGSAGVFGSALSKGTFIATSTTQSRFAAETLPLMQEIIRTFMYVGFPIILIVQLASGGIKILQNYVMAMLWIELWAPSFGILNYFVQREASVGAIEQLSASAQDTGLPTMLTIANMDPMLDTIATQSAIAANWFWTIPMLTGFLLFGGIHALMGMTSAVAGAATRGADMEYQQQKQMLQDSYTAVNEHAGSSYANAESMAYNANLGHAETKDANILGQIEQFKGHSGMASASMQTGRNTAATTAALQSKTNTQDFTNKGLTEASKVNADSFTMDNQGYAKIAEVTADLSNKDMLEKSAVSVNTTDEGYTAKGQDSASKINANEGIFNQHSFDGVNSLRKSLGLKSYSADKAYDDTSTNESASAGGTEKALNEIRSLSKQETTKDLGKDIIKQAIKYAKVNAIQDVAKTDAKALISEKDLFNATRTEEHEKATDSVANLNKKQIAADQITGGNVEALNEVFSETKAKVGVGQKMGDVEYFGQKDINEVADNEYSTQAKAFAVNNALRKVSEDNEMTQEELATINDTTTLESNTGKLKSERTNANKNNMTVQSVSAYTGEVDLAKKMGDADSTVKYAKEHFGGDTAGMNQFFKDYALAQQTGNATRIQQLAKDHTDGDVTALHHNMAGQGVKFSKDGKSFVNSYDDSGNAISSTASWTTPEGQYSANYDKDGLAVNFKRNNDSIDSQKTEWKRGAKYEGAREEVILSKLETSGMSKEKMKQTFRGKAFVSETKFTFDGAKDFINDVLTYGEGATYNKKTGTTIFDDAQKRVLTPFVSN